jgi:hypothetical protein
VNKNGNPKRAIQAEGSRLLDWRQAGSILQGLVSVEEILSYLTLDRYMGKRESAKYCGVSVRTLDSIPRDQLRRYKPAGKVLFKRSELDSWMNRNVVKEQEVQDLDQLAERIMKDFQRQKNA